MKRKFILPILSFLLLFETDVSAEEYIVPFAEPTIYISLNDESSECSDISEAEIELMALIVVAESEDQPEYGQRLVIDTILNRVDSSEFPDNISDVIYQRNAFSSIWNGRISRCSVTDYHRQLVREEVNTRSNFEALYFRTGKYSKYGKHLFLVGDHYFSGK